MIAFFIKYLGVDTVEGSELFHTVDAMIDFSINRLKLTEDSVGHKTFFIEGNFDPCNGSVFHLRCKDQELMDKFVRSCTEYINHTSFILDKEVTISIDNK